MSCQKLGYRASSHPESLQEEKGKNKIVEKKRHLLINRDCPISEEKEIVVDREQI